MLLLASQNVTGLVLEYEDNATITWVAQPNVPLSKGPNGFVGNYTGPENMTTILNYFFGRFNPNSFALGNETQTIAATADNGAVVNSKFAFSGQSNVIGHIDGTISAQDVYSVEGDTWLIYHETWNFTSIYLQYPGFEF